MNWHLWQGTMRGFVAGQDLPPSTNTLFFLLIFTLPRLAARAARRPAV
jgi:hypothetical protein